MPTHAHTTSRANLSLRTVAPLSIAAIVPFLCACAGNSTSNAQPQRDSGSEIVATPPATSATPTPEPSTPLTRHIQSIERAEPWRFSGQSGVLLHTPHYRIFATETDPLIIDRIPRFMESALTHYQRALTHGPSGTTLPEPTIKLETYILQSRAQWQELTRQLLGTQAEPFLSIQRGGYAWGGKAVFFDIGERDTFTIAAHEGWHQYTQRTFKQPLPGWIEEGVATYMEGHIWDEIGRAEFRPWANTERFEELRLVVGAKRLLPLERLLETSPTGMLETERGADAPAYYAQVWALTHFLASGDRAPSLSKMLRDAAAGTLDRTIIDAQENSARAQRSSLSLRHGSAAFIAYFGDDFERTSALYEQFVQALIRPGSIAAIREGRSPMERAATNDAPAERR